MAMKPEKMMEGKKEITHLMISLKNYIATLAGKTEVV